MFLPWARYSAKIPEYQQINFRGIERSKASSDGSIYDMQNISTDNCPVLSSTPNRKLKKSEYDKVWHYGVIEKEYVIAGETSGNEYPVWEKYTYYSEGEIVGYAGTLFKVKAGKYVDNDDSIAPPTNSILWEPVTNTTFSYDGEWSKDSTCIKDSVWAYDGSFYRNITGKNNADFTPDEDSENWKKYSYASFYYDGQKIDGLELIPGQKQCEYLNGYIVILPDKMYYRIDDGSFGYLTGTKSGEIDLKYYKNLCNDNGYIEGSVNAGLIADDLLNKIKIGFVVENKNSLGDLEGVIDIDLTKIFRDGDSIKIELNPILNPDNYAPVDGNYVVEKVEKNVLTFASGTFAGVEFGSESLLNNTWYFMGNRVVFSKGIPEMDFLCVSNNRMWGCKEDTVYASALGDVFEWQRYSGLESDPIYLETSDVGNFTGCVEYSGHPLFFKEHEMYSVYGSTASTFTLQKSADYGLRKDSPNGACVVDSVLYFLSPNGMCAYTGGIPGVMSDELKRDLSEGYAGTDGKKLYLSCNDGYGRIIYVYDTANRIWSSESFEDIPLGIGNISEELRLMDSKGNLMLLNKPRSEWQNEADTPTSYIEFNDFYEGTMSGKHVGGLIIRASVEPEYDALEIYVQYNSDGIWHKSGSIYNQNNNKKIVEFNFFPIKCDHYRIKLVCNGKFTLYGITRKIDV